MNYRYLLLFLIYWLICLTPISSKAFKNPELAFQFLTDDAVLLDIYGYYDNAGLLEGYTSHINTPVCEDSSCYDAEIHFYWDRIGNFKKIKIIPDNPLTKLDHIPFTKSDYQKLTQILFIKSPSFVYLKRNQLVEEANAGGIDGTTSATITQVKEDMVDGAIYTCYTLWHIANGQIVFKIKAHTAKKLNEQLILKILESKNIEEQFFIIENIDAGYFDIFLPQILSIGEKHQGYFVASIIENIPTSLLKNDVAQDFFAANYDQLNYQSQLNLLERLQNVQLKISMLIVLLDGIRSSNSVQNEKIINLIINNSEGGYFDELKRMFKILHAEQIEVSEELFNKLMALGNQYKPLKKDVKRFNKTHSQF